MASLVGVSYKTAWLMLHKFHEAYKYYHREVLREWDHPLSVLMNNPALEEKAGYTDERLMAAECAKGDEDEGFLPSNPAAAEAFIAAGLLMDRKITRKEWIQRRQKKRELFQIPKHRFQFRGFFLLHFNACLYSVPLSELKRPRQWNGWVNDWDWTRGYEELAA